VRWFPLVIRSCDEVITWGRRLFLIVPNNDNLAQTGHFDQLFNKGKEAFNAIVSEHNSCEALPLPGGHLVEQRRSR